MTLKSSIFFVNNYLFVICQLLTVNLNFFDDSFIINNSMYCNYELTEKYETSKQFTETGKNRCDMYAYE